jgi:hypothetical protein
MSNPTPQDMLDAFNEAYNQNESSRDAGRADCLYHIGGLLNGQLNAGTIHSVQDDLADTANEEYDAVYHYAYLATWNAVHGLLTGKSFKQIAKES